MRRRTREEEQEKNNEKTRTREEDLKEYLKNLKISTYSLSLISLNRTNIKIKYLIMPWYGFNIEDAIVISKSTSINLNLESV